MKNISGLAALSLFTISFGLLAGYAGETLDPPSWPCFHGAGRDNISTETGLLKKWPKEGPAVAWKFSGCGKGYSGVSIADGMVFTAGDFDHIEMVMALDLKGNLLWKTPNGDSWKGSHPGSRTTPAYDEGNLYHMNPIGRIAAFRAQTGEELWAVDLKEKFGARYGIWAMSENVVVEGDRVFCVPGGSEALVVALDKKTGETVWVCSELDETASYCSPFLATYKGVKMLLTLTQKSVVAIDIETGKLLWSYPHIAAHDQNVTTPLFSDGYVFVASGHSAGGRLLKINETLDGVTEVWWKKELDNCHGGVILQDGHIFGSACKKGGKGFFSAELLTGKIQYIQQDLEKISFTCAEGKFYGITQRGLVVLIDYGPTRYKLVSSFELPMESRIPSFAHPVVCDGKLYLRQGSNLFAYTIRPPQP